MSIRVKFFAALREQLGRSESQLTVVAPLSVAAVWQQVCGEVPLPAHILCAVNLDYAELSTLVHNGDEVAFFPPVTGG